MKKEGIVEALCAILYDNGALTRQEASQLKKGFQDRSEISFDDFLLEEGLVPREDVLEALSTYYGVPYMDPIGYFFDHYLLTKFPKDFLLRNLILPVEVINDTILVIVANNPNDEELLSEIGRYVSYDLQFMVSIASEIIDSVEEFYDKSLTDLELDDNLVPEMERELDEEALEQIEEIPEEK